MAGHVFHPGHHELHGITVVLETKGPRTYVGRFDSVGPSGVELLDVGIHDASASDTSVDDYIRKSIKFGVRSEQKHLVVPAEEVARIRRLGDAG